MSVAVGTGRQQGAAGASMARSTRRRSSDWSRRAPLLPALIFTIILTQLPFVVTLGISFMDWNAYYPDERRFAGFANFRRVFTDVNIRHSVWVTIELTVVVVLVSLASPGPSACSRAASSAVLAPTKRCSGET